MERGTARAAQKSRQKSAQRSALGLNPWWTCTAVTGRAPSAAIASSSTTESTPPEKPTHTLSPGGSRNVRSLGELLELAIVHPSFLAPLEQRIGREVLQAAQALLDLLLQALRGLRGIAVRSAQRLGDDLVDHAEGLQARRGDAQALRGLACILRALPEDRGASLGRDHRVRGV